MTPFRFFVAILLWVLFTSLACWSQPAPAPMLPLVQPIWTDIRPDAATIALCTGDGNTVDPQVTLTPTDIKAAAGRYGAGMEFVAGSSVHAMLPKALGNLQGITVETWVNAGKSAERTELFSMLQGTKTLWALNRLDNGMLVLTFADQVIYTSAKPLPAGQWHHLALAMRKEDIIQKAWIGLYLDGVEIAHLFSPRFPAIIGTDVVVGKCAGNALPGSYDNIQISSTCRHFYAQADQPWLDPDGRRPLRQGKPYFRNSDNIFYAISFDGTLAAQLPAGAKEGAATAPAAYVPGVRGKAVLLDGHENETSVTFPLDAPIDFTKPGMLDFWLQPADWDNHCLGAAKEADKDVPVIQIIGTNPATHQEKVLMSWGVDRSVDVYDDLPDFHPGKWSQVVLTWDGSGTARPYFDQKYVFPGNRRNLAFDKNAVKDFPSSAIRFSSGRVRTHIDELTVYRTRLPFNEFERTYTRFQPALAPLPALSISADYQMYNTAIGIQFCMNADGYANAAKATIRAFAQGQPKQTLGETTVTTITNGAGSGRLELSPPATGKYAVEVMVYDAAGKELAKAQADCPDATPAWYQTKAGLFADVPKPWTPLAIQGQQAACWSTTFTVGAGGWLSHCVTRGQELFAGPMSLVAESEQGPVAFTGQAPKLAKADNLGITWQGKQTSALVDADLKCAMEFDGMIRHELTLTPHGQAKFTRLMLDIPLKNEQMTLWHSMPLGAEGTGAGALATGENRIWDTATAYKQGRWKSVLSAGSFVPMLWVGNEERGFCWFADNDRGWFPTNAAPAIELVRKGDTLVLRLNLIAEPSAFDTPRTIVFGVIPTPTKSFPADGRAWTRGGTKDNPLCGNLSGAFDGQMSAAVENFSIYPIRGWDWAEQCGQSRRDNKKGANILYMSAYWINERLKDWYQFSWEWEGSNGGRAHYTPSYVDYLTSEFDNWYGRNILDGIYIDEVYPNYNARPEAGGSYVLPNGKVQPTASIFQEREFFKRLYGLMVQYGKQPYIIEHMTGTMVAPLISFATLTLDGEGNWIRKGGRDFMDCWPLERLRAMNVGAGGGNVSLWLPMLDESSEAFKTDPAWRRAGTRTMLAEVLLHDIWFMFDRCDSPFIYQFTAPALRSFDIAEPDLTFTGYWVKQPVATCTNENVKISTYHKDGKILLVATNFAHETTTATVKIDLVKAGLQVAGIKVDDLEKRYADQQGAKLKVPFTAATAPVLNADGTVAVEIAPRDYRLIVVER